MTKKNNDRNHDRYRNRNENKNKNRNRDRRNKNMFEDSNDFKFVSKKKKNCILLSKKYFQSRKDFLNEKNTIEI